MSNHVMTKPTFHVDTIRKSPALHGIPHPSHQILKRAFRRFKLTWALITALTWAMPLSTKALALPTANSNSVQADLVATPQALRVDQNGAVTNRLKAIVQLEGLKLPPPQTQGKAIVPLALLPRTRVFTFQATVGGQSGWFLLDTGASTTMVSTPFVQQLQLKGKPIASDRLAYAVAGDGCADGLKATLHRLPPLSLPGAQVEGLQGLQFANTVIPEGISGVMGMDVFSRFDVHIIPRQRELRLLPPTPLPAVAIDRAIPLQEKLGVMLATLKVNGQGPFTFLLDTGADSTFISRQIAQQLQLENRQPIQVRGFCGIEEAERSHLASVQLQQHQRQDLDTIILSSSILKVLGVDGILGQNFLNHYQQYWRFHGQSDNSLPFEGTLILTP